MKIVSYLFCFVLMMNLSCSKDDLKTDLIGKYSAVYKFGQYYTLDSLIISESGNSLKLNKIYVNSYTYVFPWGIIIDENDKIKLQSSSSHRYNIYNIKTEFLNKNNLKIMYGVDNDTFYIDAIKY